MRNLDIAVRLADEGVPLRAIARATQIPSDDLRLWLQEAKEEGCLIDLPRDDWPPGYPRDQRALELSRLMTLDRHVVHLLMRQLFSLAPMEIQLFLSLIQNTFIPKDRTGMTPRTMDVHMCKLRQRLRPHGITIMTLWGYGYQLPADDRRRALDYIFGSLGSSPGELKSSQQRSLARALSVSAASSVV